MPLYRQASDCMGRRQAVLAKEWVGGELERSTKSWRERKCTERGTVTVGAPECRWGDEPAA